MAVENKGSLGLILFANLILAIAMIIVIPVAVAGNGAISEQLISKDYKVCARGPKRLAVNRYDIIDIEKVVIGWREEKPFAEIIFSEMGVGAYSKMIRDAALSGVILENGGDIVVYGQIFQRDGLFFIAKLLRKGRDPLWVYIKFFGPVNSATQVRAMKFVAALGACSK